MQAETPPAPPAATVAASPPRDEPAPAIPEAGAQETATPAAVAAPAAAEAVLPAAEPLPPAGPAPDLTVPPAPTTAPAPARATPGAPRIVLSAKADAWLMVRDAEGRTLMARILHEGETWKVPNQPGLRLSTGNAGATVVLVDGVPVSSLGGSGAVRHDLPLDAMLSGTAEPAPAPAQAPAASHGRHRSNSRPMTLDPEEPATPAATASR